MIWETVKLGDACFVRRGTTITKKNAVEGDVPVIGGGTKPTYFHNEPNREAGCITISGSGASAGFVNRWDMPIFASDCSTVEPKDEMQLPKFVYFYLLSQQQFIYNNFRSGAAQPHVYAKDIETLDFPILPLLEQERIVAKLDAAFAEIDGAVEDSKKQETEVLKFGYRAITNKLKNLANIYSSKPLNDVAIIQPKKKLALEKISESDDVSFMGMKELGIEQKYTEAINTKPLNEVFKSYQYFEENDVVFAKITPCYENGKLGIMKNLKNGIGFGSSEFVVLRPNSEVHSEYIYYCLLDETFRKNGTKNMSGAVGHKRVTKDYYFNYQITVPPLSMQIECIKEFDEIWKQAEIISKLKHKKINELISLKSAILKQELQSSEAA